MESNITWYMQIFQKMSLSEAYYEVFPATLFDCFDEKTPMHFILSLKQSYDKIEDILQILRHCGAKVSFDKRDATIYTAVLADHDEVIDFYGPTFSIKYITDCLERAKQLDIGEYRQEASKHINVGDETVCMQVVYYRNFGWDSVMTEKDKQWIDHNAKVQLCKVKDDHVNSSRELRSNLPLHLLNIDSDDEDEAVPTSNTFQENDGTEQNVEKGIEDHFTIQNTVSESNGDYDSDVSNSSSRKRSKRSVHNFAISNTLSSDEEEEVNRQQNLCVTKRKNGRKPYVEEERCKILRYIVHHNEYGRIKGRELWMVMERRKICSSRTWQSMKEHFLKKIVTNLDKYDFLSNEEKRSILRVCFK